MSVVYYLLFDFFAKGKFYEYAEKQKLQKMFLKGDFEAFVFKYALTLDCHKIQKLLKENISDEEVNRNVDFFEIYDFDNFDKKILVLHEKRNILGYLKIAKDIDIFFEFLVENRIEISHKIVKLYPNEVKNKIKMFNEKICYFLDLCFMCKSLPKIFKIVVTQKDIFKIIHTNYFEKIIILDEFDINFVDNDHCLNHFRDFKKIAFLISLGANKSLANSETKEFIDQNWDVIYFLSICEKIGLKIEREINLKNVVELLGDTIASQSLTIIKEFYSRELEFYDKVMDTGSGDGYGNTYHIYITCEFIKYDRYDAIDFLVEKGFKISSCFYDYFFDNFIEASCPLFYAIIINKKDFVRYYLELDPGKSEIFQYHFPEECLIYNNIDIFLLLTGYGATWKAEEILWYSLINLIDISDFDTCEKFIKNHYWDLKKPYQFENYYQFDILTDENFEKIVFWTNCVLEQGFNFEKSISRLLFDNIGDNYKTYFKDFIIF